MLMKFHAKSDACCHFGTIGKKGKTGKTGKSGDSQGGKNGKGLKSGKKKRSKDDIGHARDIQLELGVHFSKKKDLEYETFRWFRAHHHTSTPPSTAK